MSEDGDGYEFTRRKFTITEHLDNELVTVAENHYQGNVSLCIRSAFEDHKQTLQGNGELAFGQVLTRVDELLDNQAEIIERLSTVENALDSRDPDQEVEHMPASLDSEAADVYRELVTADDSLRIEDLMERTGYSLQVIQSALGFLVDHGYVNDRDTNGERFWAVGSLSSERG